MICEQVRQEQIHAFARALSALPPCSYAVQPNPEVMDGPNAVPHQSAPAATGRSATLLAAKSSKHTVAFAPPTPPATAELPKSDTELDLEKRRQSKAFSILGAESEHAMVHLTRLELAWSQKEKFEKPPDVLLGACTFAV